jgi:ABC-type multidrug transport system ATPase subunit
MLVDSLGKRYGRRWVFRNVSFSAEPGKIVFLTGPNGAGKSTLLKCVAGLVVPSEGMVRHHDVFSVARSQGRHQRVDVSQSTLSPLGFVQTGVIDGYGTLPWLTGRATILRDRPDWDADEILKASGIWGGRDTATGRFSLGMRERLAVALATSQAPSLLILDEPTTGLDRDGVDWLIDSIVKIRDSGATIMIASHSRGLIDQLADKVIDVAGASS